MIPFQLYYFLQIITILPKIVSACCQFVSYLGDIRSQIDVLLWRVWNNSFSLILDVTLIKFIVWQNKTHAYSVLEVCL